MTATISAIRPAGADLEPARHVEHPAALVGGGAVVGWLLSRHHPAVVLSLLALSVGLVIALVMFWPFVLAAGAIILTAHWRGRGRSWGRIGGTLAAMVLAPVVILCAALIGGVGLAIIMVAGLWATWHLAIKPRLCLLDSGAQREGAQTGIR
jgi:hypothetical protein